MAGAIRVLDTARFLNNRGKRAYNMYAKRSLGPGSHDLLLPKIKDETMSLLPSLLLGFHQRRLGPEQIAPGLTHAQLFLLTLVCSIAGLPS